MRSSLAALGFLAANDPDVDSDQLLAYVRSFHAWHAEDRPLTITGGYVTKPIENSTPGSKNWELEKHLTMPAEAMVARRLETLVSGVVGRLEATANWHRIIDELIDTGAPSTPLGEQEIGLLRTGGSPARTRLSTTAHDRKDRRETRHHDRSTASVR